MANEQSMMPCRELYEIMLPAFGPCPHFVGRCSAMRWAPSEGHVPRGFCGATGTLEEVELVLIVAEPGNPYSYQSYPADSNSQDTFSRAIGFSYENFRRGQDLFHRNIRLILDSCWPRVPFAEQMRRVWITESVLCSAAQEGGEVPATVERQCRSAYLARELDLLSDRILVALGGKAQRRIGSLPGLLRAFSVAPPGCNKPEARESWKRIAECVRQRARAENSNNSPSHKAVGQVQRKVSQSEPSSARPLPSVPLPDRQGPSRKKSHAVQSYNFDYYKERFGTMQAQRWWGLTAKFSEYPVVVENQLVAEYRNDYVAFKLDGKNVCGTWIRGNSQGIWFKVRSKRTADQLCPAKYEQYSTDKEMRQHSQIKYAISEKPNGDLDCDLRDLDGMFREAIAHVRQQ